jgi:hypothetical protein
MPGTTLRLLVKLEKSLNRTVKGVEYYRWRLTLPPEVVKALGWDDGDELEPTAEGGKLVIRKAKHKSS